MQGPEPSCTDDGIRIGIKDNVLSASKQEETPPQTISLPDLDAFARRQMNDAAIWAA
jgi:hypothetical protein